MKRAAFLIMGLAASGFMHAQNNDGNLHVFNHDTSVANFGMELYYTVHTIDPSTCGDKFRGTPANLPLLLGDEAVYETYDHASSYVGNPNPYPVDQWSDGVSTYYPAASPFTPIVPSTSQYHYIKFELQDPNNPGQITPALKGEVGFYPQCGIHERVEGTGSLNSTNYYFAADAFTMGGDKWILVRYY